VGRLRRRPMQQQQRRCTLRHLQGKQPHETDTRGQAFKQLCSSITQLAIVRASSCTLQQLLPRLSLQSREHSGECKDATHNQGMQSTDHRKQSFFLHGLTIPSGGSGHLPPNPHGVVASNTRLLLKVDRRKPALVPGGSQPVHLYKADETEDWLGANKQCTTPHRGSQGPPTSFYTC